MLVITSNYPEQMPDGSVSGAKVMLDGIDDHAGWHIPLTLPKEYLDKPQSEVMTLCEKMIYQQLQPQKALNEKFAKLDTDVEKVENMLKFATGILNQIIAAKEEETTDVETVEKAD
ncbi:DUF1366 domain-containing protein [Streptococcus dysgalactiae]|uniref:Phage protein n=1 Tax=Streptococcus dysgalactiae subsp. equisimilis TaxID=119602 RepID=A0AAE9R6B1_STREQ|nr:DUF1366 domain-containing protein [Streptococcus dysgalactiae]VTT16043.1 phage protein [Streptococcus dysgalactiae]VTT25685.1 phage protein [Streptococcus dysgalactiae subsp. equisimilis]